jgi:adenine deaminase
MDDQDMARAIGRLTEIGGGVVVVENRGVRAELALPIAGIISDAPLAKVVEASRGCIDAAAKLGCTLPSPFQTMAFLALSVIPSLKLTDQGLVDVDRFELVPLKA